MNAKGPALDPIETNQENRGVRHLFHMMKAIGKCLTNLQQSRRDRLEIYEKAYPFFE